MLRKTIYMKTLFLIIAICFSVVCFGQSKATTITNINEPSEVDSVLIQKRIDSLNMKVFSTKEVTDYLIRINNKALALKELDFINETAYGKLVTELNKIMQEMDKKRRK